MKWDRMEVLIQIKNVMGQNGSPNTDKACNGIEWKS